MPADRDGRIDAREHPAGQRRPLVQLLRVDVLDDRNAEQAPGGERRGTCDDVRAQHDRRTPAHRLRQPAGVQSSDACPPQPTRRANSVDAEGLGAVERFLLSVAERHDVGPVALE